MKKEQKVESALPIQNGEITLSKTLHKQALIM